jgi:hypothetical protein
MVNEIVVPIRAMSDEEALAWLRAQPGARTTLRPFELAQRFGWSRQRASKRIQAWLKAGRVARRGGAIVAVDIEGNAERDRIDSPPLLPVASTVTVALPARAISNASVTPEITHPVVQSVAPGGRWRAVGRGIAGLAVAGCGVAIAITSIRANSWFGHSLTADPVAGEIFSNLSVLAEITACVIPTANRFYWQDGDWRTALRGFALMAIALTVVFFASSGFVLNTISTGVEARGDRTTPAVELAQRTADTLAKSRADECKRRGDRCRDLEAQERKALADLAVARADVRAEADPQAPAMHVDSNTVRTVQAAAMVGMCLCSGYLIAFGAGLIWPRETVA